MELNKTWSVIQLLRHQHLCSDRRRELRDVGLICLTLETTTYTKAEERVGSPDEILPRLPPDQGIGHGR